MARPRTLLGRMARCRSGGSAVELGLMTPLFAGVLLFTYDFSRAMSARHDLTAAASRAAELATAYGSVRTDYSVLAAEAVSSAASNGQTATATVSAWLECNNVVQANTNVICAAGQQYARFVSVTVNGSYTPLLGFGGYGSGGAVVPIRGNATVRVQ